MLLLFVTLSIGAYLIDKQLFSLFALSVPVIIYQVVNLCNFQLRVYTELNHFIEAIHYRDFSGNFNIKNAPIELQSLRKGFNEINSILRLISREKETQYQYLQKILELVETGILFYREENGEVLWMNESLKKMLQIPYLKSITSIKNRNDSLHEEIAHLKPGQAVITTLRAEQTNYKVLLSASNFQTEGKKYKLIAFQNVNEVLDETESKAWQQLLGVLTHEIMNSIAPISSLAETLRGRINSLKNDLKNNSLEDLELGIETIQRRSEGLLKFAQTYRNLNKITEPALQRIFVRDLFETLHQLMEPTFKKKNIELDIILKDPNLTVHVDPALIEQVLINLVLNAADAVKDREEPRIVLSAASLNNGRTNIKVADNGSGMSEEVLEKIFIPFFSTKKTGSGIGLTLCKQIVLLHHGTLQAQSRLNEGSVFVIQI